VGLMNSNEKKPKTNNTARMLHRIAIMNIVARNVRLSCSIYLRSQQNTHNKNLSLLSHAPCFAWNDIDEHG
jgi:hypothetical protein